MAKKFTQDLLVAFRDTKYLYIRSGEHRFVPIWVVTVEGRVIVRSWNDKASGWYRAFLAEPVGHARIGKEEFSIRAVRLQSSKINDAADAAYAAKYTTKANLKYVEGFKEGWRKAATLELLPG